MINPWINMDHSEYMVHPDDKTSFEDHNSRVTSNYKFIPFLTPEPWVGNINAPIVILLANPGATKENLAGERETNSFRKDLSIKNLSQSNQEFQHYFLNPELKDDPGGQWWNNRLSELIEETSLQAVADSIVSLETIPYHSVSFKAPKLKIPTQDYTYEILDAAIKRNAIIIAQRQISHWQAMVPSLKGYARVYQPNSPQSAYFTSGNYPAGFDEFVRAVKGSF